MASFMRSLSGIVTVLAVATSSQSSRGARLDFFLTVNDVTHTWELAASTDSPGGIAAVVVNLSNVSTAISVAPRAVLGDVPVKGFTHGYFDLPKTEYPVDHPNRWQAFAAQYTLNASSLVYGVGYAPVPDSSFGSQSSTVMVGSALSVPTVFYTGTYDPSNGTPNYHSSQNNVVGSVWAAAPPPGSFDPPALPEDVFFNVQTVGFNRLIVPEPAAWLLSLIGISVLFWKKAILVPLGSRNLLRG